MFLPTASLLPYAQATPTQRAQALHTLRQRLRHHFPTLPERAFARALEELRPNLLVHQKQLSFAHAELTQLVQVLAASPEHPLLNPPIYGLPALELAQHSLRTSELSIRALTKLVARRTRCGSHLYALVQRLVYAYPLAEQVVQAWRWDLPSSPRLPSGLPGGGPTPGSLDVGQWLQRLAATSQEESY